MARERRIASLVGFLAVCYATAAIGGWATAGSVSGWFQTLRRPWFQPPDWVFGPVWTVLYTLMAVAAWRVYVSAGRMVRGAHGLFAVQLALNLAWSLIFFGAHQIGAAALEIVLLLAAIVGATIAFWRVSRVAGALMIPYVLWVSFATALNIAIWRLN